ncbi:MAG: hypothetical protein JO041_11405 [Acidobacteria bacterium]|nr:hypothetical protein [Acidobacteriota bacterium]
MSLAALSVVVVYASVHGIARPAADEGVAAHLWQLLMAGQAPVAAWFAVRWLPKEPRQSALILVMQAGAALAAMAPVWYFHL